VRNILILGAAGGIARVATDLCLAETDVRVTLYLRNALRLKHLESDRVLLVEGDVLSTLRRRSALRSGPGRNHA
jgi:saccharopine dehydrogenase-like NADP-dependent oxidoreductase